MKKTSIRNVAIASGIAALAVLGVGIANPTALVPTFHQVAKHVQHTSKLAAPSAHPISFHVNDTANGQFGVAQFSANQAYPGQPVLLTLGTTWPAASVDAPGAGTKAVRPIIDQSEAANYTETVTHFLPPHDKSMLSNSPGHIEVGYWQLTYSTTGKHTVTVHLGGGHVKQATITVLPMPTKYHDVHYRGLSESTVMKLGIDSSSEQPSHWPWSFGVQVNTNHTHYSHNILRVTDKWSVPFTIHADEQGTITETLKTSHIPSQGTFQSPSETFAPTQAANPNYVATFSTPTTVTVHGTQPVRFWHYWLGQTHNSQSWTWKPTLIAEWEWLVLAGVFAGLSLLGGFKRRNKGTTTSNANHGGKAAL